MTSDCPFLSHREHTLLFQGAEACLYILNDPNKVTANGQFLLKRRLNKKYRHAELDKKLTQRRITQEGRALLKCQRLGIRVPVMYLVDLSERVILMEYLSDHISLKSFLETSDRIDSKGGGLDNLAHDVAKVLVEMHDNGVIHGDLTTSNLLVKRSPDTSDSRFSIVPIDFGLSSTSDSNEDKAVDLYVLERAILTTHANMSAFFGAILKHYVELSKFGNATKLKLDEVRARGRKRDMLG